MTIEKACSDTEIFLFEKIIYLPILHWYYSFVFNLFFIIQDGGQDDNQNVAKLN